MALRHVIRRAARVCVNICASKSSAASLRVLSPTAPKRRPVVEALLVPLGEFGLVVVGGP